MSLRKASLDAFRARVDATLRELFPCTLEIGGEEIAASGPGGRAMTDFLEAGQSPEFRFPFRIPAADLATPPVIGLAVDWIISESETLPLEVFETSRRPHEDVHHIVCRHRRRA